MIIHKKIFRLRWGFTPLCKNKVDKGETYANYDDKVNCINCLNKMKERGI